MSRKKDIATAILGITVAIILWITILSREKEIDSIITYQPLQALVSFVKEMQRGRIGANFLGNIVMFVPTGILFPVTTGRKQWFWTIGAGFSFSLVIEVIQLFTARGCFDPDDIILNTLGTAIGYGIYRAIVHKKTVDAENV